MAVNVIGYTFAPADTDGDGDVDLFDVGTFQDCFHGRTSLAPCGAYDLTANSIIDLRDFAALNQILTGP